MPKILTGKVISTKMQDTAVVEVSRRVPHKLYKKLLKRSKHFKVDVKEQTVSVGQTVRIVETKPVAKDKYFKVLDVVNIHSQAAKAEKSAPKTKKAAEAATEEK